MTRRPDQFSLDRIKFLEGIGASVGIALARKQMEEALQKSEEKYRGIFENAVEGISQTSPEGQFINANPAMARIYGFSSPEELKMNITDTAKELFTNPEDRMRYRKLLEEQGTVSAFEAQMKRKDGEKIWVSINAKTVKNEEGKILYFEGITENITQRKQAEEALFKEMSISESTIESLPGIFCIFNNQGKFLRWNKNLELISGYSAKEISDMHSLDFFPGENRKRIEEKVQEAFEKGEVAFEADFVTKDGRKTPYSVTGKRLDLDHTPCLVGVGLDISERLQAEEALKKSLAQLQKANEGIIEAISMAVETRDPYTSGHQKRVSRLAEAIALELKLTKEQVEAIHIAAAIHDLGKISIPADILSKPTKLTKIEFGLVKTHSEAGYRILKDIEFQFPLAQIVLQHHERLDGSGYPKGLKDQEILLEARIIAVADVVEAMATFRPYRPALGIDLALEGISKDKGRLYDLQAVDACLRLFREKGFRFEHE